MRSTLRLLLCLLAFVPVPSWAAFHLWQISEVYSNADGTVQFVELTTQFGSQQFLNNAASLVATNVGATQTHTFTFNHDLPGDTTGKRMLVATPGFAALGIVTPDYTIPNGFLFQAGGSVTFSASGDTVNHGALPGGTRSVDHGGVPGTATPTNFAGQTGSIPVVGISPNPVVFSDTSMNTSSPPNLVTITNNHSVQIAISSITATAEFAVLLPMGNCTPLAAGASCQVGMYFTPTGEGTRNGTLTVSSDAPGSPHTAPVSGVGERSLVTHYYRAILRRAPDAGGKAFWQGEAARMQSIGANINEAWFAMAQQFFFSAEYLALNRDNNGFVTDLYTTFFNRAPDSGGLAFWSNQLGQGMPREVILASFMFSAEFAAFTQAIFGNTTARAEVDVVLDFYRGLLARLPDPGGFTFWVQQFRTAQCSGNTNNVYVQVEAISGSFMNGAEYFNKNRSNAQFVGDLYNAFLRRGGDLGGVQFWIAQLNGTLTRDQVRQNFVNSTEFQGRVTAVVNQGCMP